MPYYRFDNGLQPLSAPPEDWQGVLAVLEPGELHSAPLPSWLTPPAAPADPHESQFCWLRIDRDGVTGHLRTPVRASQSARHMGFTWTRNCLLLSDPDHAAADCIAHLTTQRTQPPGSPDAFVVALLIWVAYSCSSRVSPCRLSTFRRKCPSRFLLWLPNRSSASSSRDEAKSLSWA